MSVHWQLPVVVLQIWPVPQLASVVHTQRSPLSAKPTGQQEAPVHTQAPTVASKVWSGGQQEVSPQVQFCRVLS